MAEGLARHFKGEMLEPFSAGIETHGVNPNAVEVMQEIGIDISNQKSELLSKYTDVEFDYVITVCDNANESCPVFPGKAKVIHRSFDDPPRLAQNLKMQSEILDRYRRVRDEIKNFILSLPESLFD